MSAIATANGAMSAAEFPEAEITNGLVTAKLYLPDANRGYYRGTRFDWSGVIYSLRAQGHEYYGQWFEKYDPKLHDAIMGPVEEYLTNDSTIGYEEAKPGETFVRIGIGLLRKPEEKAFQRFKYYDIVDNGKWGVRKRKDQIEFTHQLDDKKGYAYEYKKTIRLTKGKPEMVIVHSLRNKGRKNIETMQYNHNFFVIDGQPTGPGATAKFPFDLRPTRPVQEELSEVQGGEIRYKKELQKGQSVFNLFEGYGKTASDYDVRVEHRKAGAGARITGDRPMSRLVYWSIRTTFCPEPYVTISAAPGQETKWTYTYQFYALK